MTYMTLREVFPTKPWRYLRDKAANWSGGNVEQLVEQLLINENISGGEANSSVILLDDTSDFEASTGGDADESAAAEDVEEGKQFEGNESPEPTTATLLQIPWRIIMLHCWLSFPTCLQSTFENKS